MGAEVVTMTRIIAAEPVRYANGAGVCVDARVAELREL